MTCVEVSEMLPVYLDHELSGQEARLVEDHLGKCPACRDDLSRQTRLDARIEILRSSIPSPGVTANVMQRLSAEPAQHAKTAAWPGAAPVAAALGALAVLAVVVVLALLPGRRAASSPPLAGPGLLYLLRHEPEGSLLVLDAARLSAVTTIALGANPTALTVPADGRQIYISGGLPDIPAMEDSRLGLTGIWVLDSKTLTVTHSIPVGYAVRDIANGPQPGQIVLTLQPTGRYLSLDGSGPDLQAAGRVAGQLLSLDTSSERTTWLADLLPLPRGLVTTPDGKLAFAISHDAVDYERSEVTIVDVAARRTLATIALPGTEALAVAPDGQRVFVASVAEPYIWAIERSSLKAIAFRLPGLPDGVEVRQIAVSADGSLLALALAGKDGANGGLVVLDTRRFDALLVLPAPGGYQSVAFAPGHRAAYAVTPGGHLDVIAMPGGRIIKSIDGVGNVTKIVVR